MRALARQSISTRLALWYGRSLLLLLGLVAGFLYGGFHVTLHRDFDAALAAEADRVEAALPSEGLAGGAPAAFVRAAEASPGCSYESLTLRLASRSCGVKSTPRLNGTTDWRCLAAASASSSGAEAPSNRSARATASRTVSISTGENVNESSSKTVIRSRS